MLCPMHIPVLLAGFVLGPWYGSMIGFILPLTRFFIFGMPILYPIGIGMMFELAVYGLVSGLVYRILHQKTKLPDIANIYISLVFAMILGRAVWGVTRAICGLFPNNSFTWKLFLSGAFLTAWPGILFQLFFIPLVIFCLSRANLLKNYMELRGPSKEKQILSSLKKQIQLKEGVFILAIDGMSGSGKTTLAQTLASKLDANLIHMDDFYLPIKNRPQNFLDLPGSHMDFQRFKEEVLTENDPITYQRFDCKSQEYFSISSFLKKKVLIVEGSYSLHPELGKYYDYAIFKKISKEAQIQRIEKRNPESLQDFTQIWIPLEEAYFEQFQIETLCDESL